ncbi:MAG TPA: hypothetical protein VFS22_09195 [Flavisolibacter sp.]|nr:hypothetical protein [Flavisolibacter sp.]
MFKFLTLLVVLAACNTSPESGKNAEKDGTAKREYKWSKEEENEFLLGCVDSAKVKMDEAAAFAQCKCILAQLKENFPNMDSAAPALMDVKRVAAYVEKCK